MSSSVRIQGEESGLMYMTNVDLYRQSYRCHNHLLLMRFLGYMMIQGLHDQYLLEKGNQTQEIRLNVRYIILPIFCPFESKGWWAKRCSPCKIYMDVHFFFFHFALASYFNLFIVSAFNTKAFTLDF